MRVYNLTLMCVPNYNYQTLKSMNAIQPIWTVYRIIIVISDRVFNSWFVMATQRVMLIMQSAWSACKLQICEFPRVRREFYYFDDAHRDFGTLENGFDTETPVCIMCMCVRNTIETNKIRTKQFSTRLGVFLKVIVSAE